MDGRTLTEERQITAIEELISINFLPLRINFIPIPWCQSNPREYRGVVCEEPDDMAMMHTPGAWAAYTPQDSGLQVREGARPPTFPKKTISCDR